MGMLDPDLWISFSSKTMTDLFDRVTKRRNNIKRMILDDDVYHSFIAKKMGQQVPPFKDKIQASLFLPFSSLCSLGVSVAN
jgi:hypothetical protein